MALLGRPFLSKLLNFTRTFRPVSASISTSKKNKEVPSQAITERGVSKPPVTVADFADTKPKYWISYGFSETNYQEDRDTYHILMFLTVTVAFCGCTFLMMYIPDFKNQDWVQREAYLELERRERLGLPLIDRNLIDPRRVNLPSEEELEGVEIIL